MSSASTGNVDPHWERLQELFSRAVELPESEREAFIARETASDSGLRKELLELLACDSGRSTGPLTQALGAALDATTRDRRKQLLGRIVGNYKLVSVLGHGGTGTVYLGERADRQYSAQVAVKIVDSSIVHGELGMRFRAERQILASLNHPNIARLLDAGETPDGQPYLIMEYVHGEPVDRYCDRKQLDVRARLELFLEICGAVQYAHQNLIVHRDLKPANILVASEGAPKLLDFGIAKLLDAGDAAAVLAMTRMNDRLLTPEYASPEQILGRQVTTASDVYALGVVLYEMLTGLRPYTVPASASQLELERSICVSDPQRPSAAVRRAVESGPLEGQSEIAAIAMARCLAVDKLQKRLTGDIDAIVMRALRKEQQHRYSSVEQFAADVRRYLSREPVHARQGTWLYYSQRFVRRHAFGVSAGTTFFIFVIAFAVAMSIQTKRVAIERDRAEQESQLAGTVSEFMLHVFEQSDPFQTYGEEVTARQLIDYAGRRIQSDLDQHPEVRARLLEAMARVYRRQGQYARSLSFLEEALVIREQMSGGHDSKTASVLTEMAITLRQLGDHNRAGKSLRRAIQISKELKDERSTNYAKLLTNLGRVEMVAGDIISAQKHFEQSLALNEALDGPEEPEVAAVLLELSNVFLWKDEAQAAERVARQAINIYRLRGVPDRHPDRVVADIRLAEALQLQNRMNEASALFESSLESQKLLYGENSRQVADILDSLAQIRRSQGLLAEAETYARHALQVHTNALGEKHYMTAFFRSTLASLLGRRGKYQEAEREVREALRVYDKNLPSDHPYVASSEHVLGEILLATGRLNDAEAMLTAAMNRWKRTDARAWRSARSASALGEVMYRQGRFAEAERHLVESYLTLADDDAADHEARVKAQERVTRFYTDRGERNKLQELMLAASGNNTASEATRSN